MKMKTLGRSDIKVSELSIGTMTFGEQNTQAECDAIMDMALDYGVNFVDTAEMYAVPIKAETYGHTETMLGNWMKARGNRDQIVLATKVAGPSDNINWIRDGNHRLDRQNIIDAAEASLQRLQSDVIDLYQVHWPDRNTNTFGDLGYVHDADEQCVEIEETLRALSELVDAGKVRTVGLSNETPWGVMTFLRLAEQYDLPRAVSIQNPYNFLNRTYEVGLSEVSIREDCGLMCYGILGSGALSGKYLNNSRPEGARATLWPEYFSRYFSKGSIEATQKYVALAHEHGITPPQMAVAWGLTQPFMLSIILGATKTEQVEEQLLAAEMTLSAELLSQIENIHRELPNPYLIQ